jgi:hypothetical protein
MRAFTALVTLMVMTSASASTSAATDKASLRPRVGKALEDQLACLKSPTPASAIRSMLADGLIFRTKFAADGSPVFAPTGDIYVYGSRVRFITGWEQEGGRAKSPFWRGPGTAPPLFLQVTLEMPLPAIRYTPHEVRGSDGIVQGSYSTIAPADEYYIHSGTTITCYG